MAVLRIPLVAEPSHYEFRTELDEVFYVIRMDYNKVASSWYLSLRNDEGENLLRGIRLRLTSDLLKSYKHLAIPQGRFSVFDTQGGDEEPSLENLGTRVQLLYVEEGTA